MQELEGADTIEVLVDNEIAVQNVTKMATSKGATVTSEKVSNNEYKVVIEVSENCCELMDDEKTTIVVINSDKMGNGNDELGKVLIKGFIFAITQLDTLPKTMLFYNGGATLTCEGSDSLEDLKLLESEGVEILTCGTCLDYYQLKEKLAVGGVTNMYSIVEAMNGADRVIRP
jgi:selenium metabolism protein YedF